MMRFRDTPQHATLIAIIRDTLAKYGLNLLRADWRIFKDELWANVCYYMEASAYGIAIFEQINGLATSPNVSLELGYMLAKKRRCLLLKERQVQMLQADLAGHLCRSFDVDQIEDTVEPEVRAWLKDLGITKRVDERLLVFLSSGGTCRDPMAKAIMQQLLAARPPGYHLRVEALALNSPSLDRASRAARRAIQQAFGSDLLVEHRPTMITPELAEDADLILVMDHHLLAKTLPLRKTHAIKPFLGLSGDVADPWPDGDDEESQRRYVECCTELRNLLEDHFETIVEMLRPSQQGQSPDAG